MRLIRFGAVALLARHYGDRLRLILESRELQTAVIALVFVACAAMIASAVVLFRRTRPGAFSVPDRIDAQPEGCAL
jgi:hypothetical protein